MSWLEGRSDRNALINPETTERQALIRRRRRRRMRAGLAGTGLLIIAGAMVWGSLEGVHAGLGWVRQHSRLLEAREINTNTTTWFGAWDIVEISGLAPGDDLLATSLDEVAVRLEAHPRIASADVSRRLLTRTFYIRIEEVPPVAFALGSEPTELGLQGQVLGAPQGPRRQDIPRGLSLPMVAGVHPDSLTHGRRVNDPGVRRALAFLELMKHYEMRPEAWISEVTPDRDGMLVVYLLDSGIPVKVGDGRISQRKIQALFAALEDLRSKGIRPAAIDLRFEDQIVVRQSEDEA